MPTIDAPPSSRPASVVGTGQQAMQVDLDLFHENAHRASALLKAMSNEVRLKILCQLGDGEKYVGELERIVGLSQSAVSQHLARLRRDDLVKTRRTAQTIFYSLSGPEAGAIIGKLQDLFCGKTDSAA